MMQEKLNRRRFLHFTAQSFVLLGLLKIVANGQKNHAKVKGEASETPFFAEQDLFVAGANGYHTYRIPSLIVTKHDSLLAFCEARKNDQTDSGDIDLVFRRSRDHGKTWSEQQILWNDAGNTCGNPCPVVDRKTGTIHLLLTRNLGVDREAQIIDGTSRDSRTVWHCQSTDDGKSWTTPTEITGSVKSPNWSWYATGPGAGIQLSNNRLIVPCDHVEKGTKINFSHVIYSDDNGQNWRLGGRVPSGETNECEVVELADERLLLNMRSANRSLKQRAIAISADKGLTWSELSRDAELIEPICQASIRRYSSVKDNRPAGRNLILFSNPASDKREKMTIRLSSDECQTWTTAKTIWAGAAAYSCLAVASDKNIFCLYERGTASPYEKITLAAFNLRWLTDFSSPSAPASSKDL